MIAENKKTIDVLLPLAAASFVGYNMYKQNPKDVQKIAIAAGVVFIVAWIATAAITKNVAQKENEKKSAEAVEAKALEIQQETGLAGADLERVKQVAAAIYAACWKYWLGEDEAEMIKQVNTLQTAAEVKACSKIYQTAYGRSMKGDFDEYIQIHTLINSLVKENWY